MMSSSLDELLRIRSACLANASTHITSAQLLRQAGQYNVAFECAILALEEVGKAVILMMTRTRDLAREDESPDWMDDHTKKLFWAVFSVAFGHEAALTPEGFDALQGTARNLHKRRLDCSYVNYKTGGLVAITPEECEEIIRLTMARLEMEEQRTYKDGLTEEDLSNLRWFYAASEHQITRPIIWNWTSIKKLNEFGGDTHDWIVWLREQVAEAERNNQEFIQKEFDRKRPRGQARMDQKWSMTFHLFCASHSIRPRTLANWNKHQNFIRMHPGGKRNELRIDLTFPKRVLVKALWQHSFDVVTRIVLALNIGCQGFFWWYLPEYRTRFYDSLKDLEANGTVQLDADSGLNVEWGNHAFGEDEARGFGLIFGYLLSRTHAELEAFQSYMRGLALIARSDLLLPLQGTALVEFRNSAQSFLKVKEPSGLHGALVSRLQPAEEVVEHLRQLIDLANTIGPDLPPKPVTITQALQFRIYFDAVIVKEAQSNLQRFANTGQVRASTK
ncbi:MAG TPA: AbiV family abortive infection protein [Bryocella sp.]|nr:AbiV family abortive infection protein [Bryocella sp.]